MPIINPDPRPMLCSQAKYAALVMISVSPEHVFRTKALAWFRRAEDRRNRVIRDVFFRLHPVPYPALPTA